MKKLRTVTLLLMTGLIGAAGGRSVASPIDFEARTPAGFEEGVKAYQSSDYAMALKQLRPLADQGYAPAQYNLGLFYDRGQGVPQDYKKAIKWYRKAAEQGLPQSQESLGVMYAEGRGTTQDYEQALIWYRKAADQGYAPA